MLTSDGRSSHNNFQEGDQPGARAVTRNLAGT